MPLSKKKSLGQHFLKSAAYVRAVADAAKLVPGELVIEVGPGDGALTRELLARQVTVVALEKDRRLIPLLQQTFGPQIMARQLEVEEADALTFDPGQRGLWGRPYKVVANIPYYITGALLEHFLTLPHQPRHLVFLMQKEVAERIARAPKESILSLSVKAYGEPVYVKTVPRGAFAPAPEVDSAILAVANISRANFATPAQEKRFFALVRAGFGQKRKLLRRNLESVLGPQALRRLRAAGIPEDARAEDVHLPEWLALSA